MDSLEKDGLGDGFGEVGVEASGGALLFGLLEGVCGEGEDRQRIAGVGCFPGTHGAGGGVSVHDGHMGVHEYQVVFAGLHLAEGGGAVVGGVEGVGEDLRYSWMRKRLSSESSARRMRRGVSGVSFSEKEGSGAVPR